MEAMIIVYKQEKTKKDGYFNTVLITIFPNQYEWEGISQRIFKVRMRGWAVQYYNSSNLVDFKNMAYYAIINQFLLENNLPQYSTLSLEPSSQYVGLSEKEIKGMKYYNE